MLITFVDRVSLPRASPFVLSASVFRLSNAAQSFQVKRRFFETMAGRVVAGSVAATCLLAGLSGAFVAPTGVPQQPQQRAS